MQSKLGLLKSEYPTDKEIIILTTDNRRLKGVISEFSTDSIVLENSSAKTRIFTELIGGWQLPKSDMIKDVDFEELTIHRLNIVDHQGKYDVVINCKDRPAGLICKGKQYKPEHRHGLPSIIFFNSEETECGGLLFAGQTDTNGNISAGNHFSLDQYDNDQVLVLHNEQSKEFKQAYLQINDRGTMPLHELMGSMNKIRLEEGEEAVAKWIRTLSPADREGIKRVLLARNSDGSAALELHDQAGRLKLKVAVTEEGNPQIICYGNNGEILCQLP